jgi:DNA polymerase III subunit beta
MKFIVSSGDLQKALQNVSGVISSSQSRPILENYLFELDEKTLHITASDGETTLVTQLDVKSVDSGRMAVPAKKFSEIIKTFNDQPLTFTQQENPKGFGNLLQILDDTDDYYLALDREEDYPALPSFDVAKSISVSSNILLSAINNTLFATSNDSLRPVLTGVFFQFTGVSANFVATDTHRLVVYSNNLLANANGGEDDLEFIVPKKPLSIFKSILETNDLPVNIDLSNNMVKFSFLNHTWITKLIEGKYPNYRSVIPVDNPFHMEISRQLLHSSIRRVSLFSSQGTNNIRFNLNNGALNLHAEDIEFSNKADMKIACNYQGEDINIGFSSKHILEMLSVCGGDDVRLKISQPNRPGIWEPCDGLGENESLLILTMPILGMQG